MATTREQETNDAVADDGSSIAVPLVVPQEPQSLTRMSPNQTLSYQSFFSRCNDFFFLFFLPSIIFYCPGLTSVYTELGLARSYQCTQSCECRALQFAVSCTLKVDFFKKLPMIPHAQLPLISGSSSRTVTAVRSRKASQKVLQLAPLKVDFQ